MASVVGHTAATDAVVTVAVLVPHEADDVVDATTMFSQECITEQLMVQEVGVPMLDVWRRLKQ